MKLNSLLLLVSADHSMVSEVLLNSLSQVYDRDAFEAKVMSDVDREMERRQKEAALERCRKELIDSAKKIAEVR